MAGELAGYGLDPFLVKMAEQLELASEANQQANAGAPTTRYYTCLELADAWCQLGEIARGEVDR